MWFESDWDFGQKLIVKGIRDGSYASYFTDITVGDALIMIDSVSVEHLSFDQAIKHLKCKMWYIIFLRWLSCSSCLFVE